MVYRGRSGILAIFGPPGAPPGGGGPQGGPRGGVPGGGPPGAPRGGPRPKPVQMPQNRAFFTGNALFQFLVYVEASQRCFSVLLVLFVSDTIPNPQAPIGSPRHEDPPGTRGEKGGQATSEIAVLSEQGGSGTHPPR